MYLNVYFGAKNLKFTYTVSKYSFSINILKTPHMHGFQKFFSTTINLALDSVFKVPSDVISGGCTHVL